LDALREGATEDDLVDIIDRSARVQSYLSIQDESLRVENGEVVYTDEDGDEEPIHGTMIDRLLDFVKEDLPVQGLVNFIKKIMQNPSYQSAKELYDFLDHRSLPICEDGDFLAYKAVTCDYRDKRTGTKDNSVGSTVNEARRKIDDNRENGCSRGLHAGTLSYVESFGSFQKDDEGDLSFTETSDKCIIVKINPMHVVSVPLCSDCQKLRTEEYYVVKDYEGELAYTLATDEGDEYDDDDDDDYDDSYDDDDSYDEFGY
jgi:hypothetical protein